MKTIKEIKELRAKAEATEALSSVPAIQIYGAARQCGKVDFTMAALKDLERDPNCPPERPMEDILHEVACSGCGVIDDECTPVEDMLLCKSCAEAWKAYYEKEEKL